MEAFKEAIAASREQSLILKGKRTKRQRPQSPIPFSLVSASSARDIEQESTHLDKDLGHNVEIRKIDCVLITPSSSSASWVSNKAEEDQEDQYIANCLILLSQGHSLPHHTQQLIKIPNHQETINNNNAYRFSSRRFLETSSSSSNNGGGKSGYYVYQCKTCDRTFPSFQALGGHRASHKKPKATFSFYSNLDTNTNIYENEAVSLVKTTPTYKTYNNNRSLVVYGKSSNNKVHECGICGAEFTSGQALGGHMRRHRGTVIVSTATPPTVNVANTELSLSSMSFNQIIDGQDHMMMLATKKAKKTVVSLDLDLNLPARVDENRVNGFSLTLKQGQEQEQKSLVLSSTTTTFVDCYY
ncbi:unnamed protein product [Cochlearia groenlandica]